MATREKAAPGTVAWVDLQTPDLEKAQNFYGGLLGWSFVGGADPAAAFYVMGQLGQRNVAGMARLRPQSSFSPMWSVYFAVDDADQVARDIEALGGKVVVPPGDVMDEGRMGYFMDPTGAFFGIWQGKRHQGAQVVSEPGAMVWHEVHTGDANSSRRFYARLFSLGERKLDTPELDYWTLHRGQEAVCGVMQMTERMPRTEPPHWNTYFAVANVDAAEKKVSELGGTVFAPAFDTPYGRMTTVRDPFGASFCLISPSPALVGA